jgi:ABC-2 type transport system permease protein
VIRAFLAGARIQLQFLRAYPDALIPFFTAPMFSVIFLMIFRHAGRTDLTAYAAIAPVFIALWWLALFNSGWTITIERWNGTLEMLVAAPSSFAAVILGRITATTMVGIVSFGETWLVARLLFGTRITIYHAWGFLATALVTLAAMAGTAVAMSSLFVLARNAVTFSNSASYPFYVLGGILVPVSVLPHWIRPVSSVVFLSWSADLLRAALRPGPMHHFAFRLGMVALLGACGLAVGAWTMRVILVRVRGSGELGTT